MTDVSELKRFVGADGPPVDPWILWVLGMMVSGVLSGSGSISVTIAVVGLGFGFLVKAAIKRHVRLGAVLYVASLPVGALAQYFLASAV